MQETTQVEGNSNKEFLENVSERFKDMFTQTLMFLEIAFPHEKGDQSENEKIFNGLRSKILRIGNDNIRELQRTLDHYVVFKLYDYKPILSKQIQTNIFNFQNKFKIIKGQGNANLQDYSDSR